MVRLKYIFYFYCLFVIFINTAYSENYSLEKAFNGLNRPWGMSFIDDHNLLVTQKSGEILKINLKTQEKIELDHNLKILEVGWQGGMLDVLYHEGIVYVSYTEKRYGKHTTTSIAAGKLVNDRLENFKNIFRSHPPIDTDIHWGSRLAVKDNYLFASVGERDQGMAAQDPTNHFGTIIRYQGEKFPELNNKVIVTSLKAQKLISLDYKNDKVINEQVLYEREGRMRDVEFNSKGEIFIIIDDSKSGIWKLIRK